jgi:hypothetical protein
MNEHDLARFREVMAEDPDGGAATGPVITGVPLEDEGEPEDEDGYEEDLTRVLVRQQIAYARSCEDVWEYRYQWGIAVPAVAVLALCIRIVAHHRSFFGALTVLLAVTILLAAWLGLL